MLATAYGEANRQHRGLMPRREHTDRRTISKYRSAFDRRSEVASQPCHHSCSGCGALRAPTAGHPHRNSAQSEPCVHCGTHAWVDLIEDESVRTLAAVEAYELETIDPGRRIREWVLRIGGAVFMGTWCFFAAANSYSAIFSGLTLLVGMVAVVYFLLGLGNARTVKRRPLPYRWDCPLPPTTAAARKAKTIEGTAASADGEHLRAPLSGRPCLAFTVVARRADAPSNAPLGLLAQEAVDLVVAGQSVARDRLELDLPLRTVEIAPECRASATVYLRSRGVLVTEDQWDYEEAILEPGAPVVVRTAVPKGVVITAAPGRRRRALPSAD